MSKVWKSIFFPSNQIGFVSPCETSKCIRWSTSHPIAFTCSFSTILEKNDQSEDFALWENLSFSATRSRSKSAWGFGFITLGFWSNNKYQIWLDPLLLERTFPLHCINISQSSSQIDHLWPLFQNHLHLMYCTHQLVWELKESVN